MTRLYSDYTLCPDITETAAQDATVTDSYGNFGLDRRDAVFHQLIQ